MGLVSRTIDASLSALNLPVKEGALVLSVQKGSPAAKAGIRGGVPANSEGGEVAVGGDIVQSIDGKKVATSEDLANIVSSKHPGETVTVKLLRANGSGGWSSKSVQVTLGSRPSKNPFESSSSSPEG
jgi:S1-C subfamily serine protease